MISYKEPGYNLPAYNCPICNAFAQQKWFEVAGTVKTNQGKLVKLDRSNMYITLCEQCRQSTLWVDGKMVYPGKTIAPLPNTDMPESVKSDFEEARLVYSYSPRSAAALLRLCVQKLCVYLGGKGENINSDIADLVKKGLPERLQQALDSVRVVGNNAVHPGVLDINDDPDMVIKLFHFVNLIVDAMITQPKTIDEYYNYKLPEADRLKISKRDANASSR